MAVKNSIGIEIRIRSVFILILVLLYAGRLGTAAPLLSVDFPIWSVITLAYRFLSQTIAFLILSVMELATSFSRELMPLDPLVDSIPVLLIILGMLYRVSLIHDATSRSPIDKLTPLRQTLVKVSLAVLALGFFTWGVFTAVSIPLEPINSLEALRNVFPFWSPAADYASNLAPFELRKNFLIYAAILIVGLIGVRGSLAFREKNLFVFVIVMLPFNLLVILGGIFAFALIPAFFIQLGNFADPALPWFERFAATLQAWLEAAGR